MSSEKQNNSNTPEKKADSADKEKGTANLHPISADHEKQQPENTTSLDQAESD